MLISLNKMMIVGGGGEQGKSEDSGYGNCYFSVENPSTQILSEDTPGG